MSKQCAENEKMQVIRIDNYVQIESSSKSDHTKNMVK